MRITGPVIPEHILKRMDPKDRKPLGKAGRTNEEIATTNERLAEKKLQRQLLDYLRVRYGSDFPVIYSRMDKKTTTPKGTPDFVFLVNAHLEGWEGDWFSSGCAWEIKLPGNKPEPHQEAVLETYRRHGWSVAVIHSIEEAKEWLNQL